MNNGDKEKHADAQENSFSAKYRQKRAERQGQPSRIRRAMELLSSGRVKEGDPLFATLIALITGALDGGDE